RGARHTLVRVTDSPWQPQQGPFGYVRFHLQGSVWTSSLVMPTVTINGYRVPVTYGENVIPVYPGRCVVEASMRWMRRYGQAGYTVDVAPGQAADIWYAAPLTQFHTGSMGVAKQSRKGGWALAGMLAAIMLIFLGLPLTLLFALSR
ncbi:MAG TPA: hypothetical protein PLU19_00675, partial [Dermatophilaceae bacterium]|nr:hypothetical protein [Dermatophilaceae bacterium]